MTHDDARLLISELMDWPLPPHDESALRDHLASCTECGAYQAMMQRVRATLRADAEGEAPDVLPAVLAALDRDSRLRWLTAAAVFVSAVVAGAAFIGLAGRTGRVEAADVPGLVLEAQRGVDALTADLVVIERGWHPDVPERTYTGSISYRAPESLRLSLDDGTTYPSAAWVPNDTRLVSAPGSLWWLGPAPCPTEAQPGCTPAIPQTMAVVNAAPFPDAAPLPLDLVVPVASFAKGGAARVLGEQVVDGRSAIGIEATAAQLDPLLAGLFRAGNWRSFHPSDRVELWLDRDTLTPLALALFPGGSDDRVMWATRRGYDDDPGVPVLEVLWLDLEVGGVGDSFPAPPGTTVTADAGFRPTPVTAWDAVPPDGLSEHVSGVQNPAGGTRTEIRSWSDGRAWLKVALTDEWKGTRLFGDLGDVVRAVRTEESGVLYVSADGTRVGIHGAGRDLIVTGSFAGTELLTVAASVGVTGVEVPDGWREAGSSDLESAADALPGLLVPATVAEFGEPAVNVAGSVVTLAYAGSGNRAFLVVEATPGELSPPLEADVRSVDVRGTGGRYTPGRGTLEWVEGGLALTLRSASLTLDELVGIATGMATS